jgi:hypothetical protein
MLFSKVRDNFAHYGLLDDRAVFFEEMLPGLGGRTHWRHLIPDCIPTRFGEPCSLNRWRQECIRQHTNTAGCFSSSTGGLNSPRWSNRQPECEWLVQGSLPDRGAICRLDMAPGNGVDLVITPGEPFPIADDSVDVAVTSSAFEHDACFWETFLDLMRVLKPGGLLYVNAPSNYAFHRYQVDCWRIRGPAAFS